MDEDEIRAFELELERRKAAKTYPRNGAYEIYLADCREYHLAKSRTWRKPLKPNQSVKKPE